MKEFLYWEDEDSPLPVQETINSYDKPDKVSDKKSSMKLARKSERLYKIFQKLSSRERRNFLKLIENEL